MSKDKKPFAARFTASLKRWEQEALDEDEDRVCCMIGEMLIQLRRMELEAEIERKREELEGLQ